MSFLGGMGGGPVLGDGLIRIGAVTNGLRGAVRNAVNDAKAELQSGASRIQGQSQGWNKAFGVIGAAAKIGFAGVSLGLLASVGAATEFEKHWAGVRKTVEGTPAELEALRHQFRELAKEIPVSVNELADIGQTAGALGIAKDSLAEFAKVTAQISFAGVGVTTEQAADAIGHLANVLHIKEPDFQRFGSTLIGLGNAGASTEGEILDIASRAGAAGKLIGLSTPAILAWGSAVSSMGIEAEAGGSALQFFFLQASKVVNEVTKTGIPSAKALAEAQMKVRIATEALTAAEGKHGRSSTQAQKASLSLMKAQDALNKLTGKGSNALLTMAKTAGLSADAFKKLFGQDATKALTLFLTGLGKLPVAQQQAVLATLKLNNIRVIRAILGLANNSKELNRQLTLGEKAWTDNTALAEAYGKRTDTLSAQLTLLVNTIKDLFISVGDSALPIVKLVVRALRDDLPKAAAFLSSVIGAIWTRSLGPAVHGMFDAFGRLGSAIAGVFDFSGGDKKANGITTLLDGIGAVAAQAAASVGALASAFAALLSNPVIAGLAKVGVIIAGISLALSGGAAVAGKLSSSVAGIARRLTFGKIGGSGAPEKTPLDGSAKALTGSAGQLDAAAKALMAAARGDVGPGYRNKGGPIGYAPTSNEGYLHTPSGTQYSATTGELTAVGTSAEAKAAYLRQKAAADAAGKGIVRETIGNLTSGVSSAVGKVKSFASGAFHLASAVFWPAMIADFAFEFAKEPVGQFIADNTKFKRAGEQMKSDFVGGLISLVQAWNIGSDAFVGHNSTMTIGKMTFKTMDLAKLGVTSATFDKLEAPAGTIDHAQGTQAVLGALDDAAQKPGEAVRAWYLRIRSGLSEDIQKAGDEVFNSGTIRVGDPRKLGAAAYQLTPDAEAKLKAILRTGLGSVVDNLSTVTRQDYLSALTDSLSGRFTSGQIGSLSTGALTKIGALIKADAQGQYSGLVDFVTQSYLGGINEAPGKPAKPRSAGIRGGGGENPDASLSGIAKLKTRVVAALTAFLHDTPTEVQQALAQVLAQSKLVDPHIVAILQKKFGDDWIEGMRNGAKLDPKKDKAVIAELKSRFGARWEEVLTEAGKLEFAKNGGADEQALKAALGKAIGGAIAALTPADLTAPGKHPESKGDAAKDRTKIQHFLDGKKGLDALADAASTDTATAKRGFKELGDGLKGAIPDESARNRFIGALVAFQNAAKAPGIDTMGAALGSIVSDGADAATELIRSGDAFGYLTGKAKAFLTAIGLGDGSSSGTGGGGGGGKKKGATGLVFDTAGETTLTVGEAGREHVAVLRNFKTMRLPRMPVAASLTHDIVHGLTKAGMPFGNPVAAIAGHSGPRVQVNADKLQLFSDGDARSLDAQLAFLAPDGR